MKLTWRREEDMAQRPVPPVRSQRSRRARYSGKRITAWSIPQRFAVDPAASGAGSPPARSIAGGRRCECICLTRSATIGRRWVPHPRPFRSATGVRSATRSTRSRSKAYRRTRARGGHRSVPFRYNSECHTDQRAHPGGAERRGHAGGLAQDAARGARVGHGVRRVVRHHRGQVVEISAPTAGARSRCTGWRACRLRHGDQSGLGRGADAGRHPPRAQRRAVGPIEVTRRANPARRTSTSIA